MQCLSCIDQSEITFLQRGKKHTSKSFPLILFFAGGWGVGLQNIQDKIILYLHSLPSSHFFTHLLFIKLMFFQISYNSVQHISSSRIDRIVTRIVQYGPKWSCVWSCLFLNSLSWSSIFWFGQVCSIMVYKFF